MQDWRIRDVAIGLAIGLVAVAIGLAIGLVATLLYVILRNQ